MKIDAVITWVDGNDPVHKRKRMSALHAMGVSKDYQSNAFQETRFQDRGEIYFCIASLLKYAPYIRRIYIVTDAQRPKYIADFSKEGICDVSKICIVDHKDIFHGYEFALPTFNSLTIETMLWRIKGISDTFVYCNDDFFLNAPLPLEKIITSDGCLIIHGRKRSVWPLAIKKVMRRIRHTITGVKFTGAHFKTAQVLGAMLAGQTQYVQIGHSGQIFRKSVLCKFFEQRPDVLNSQISHRFRSIAQFLPASLVSHLALASGQAVVMPAVPGCYLKPSNFSKKHLEYISEGLLQWGCIQSLDEFNKIQEDMIKQILVRKFYDFLPSSINKMIKS
jgi:hypothetical protein